MASKFMSDMPLAGMEAQMQQVPGFRPRKGGISVSRLKLPKVQGCGSGQTEGQGDCGPPDWGGMIGSTKQGDNGGWFIRLITFLSMSYLASSNRH